MTKDEQQQPSTPKTSLKLTKIRIPKMENQWNTVAQLLVKISTCTKLSRQTDFTQETAASEIWFRLIRYPLPKALATKFQLLLWWVWALQLLKYQFLTIILTLRTSQVRTIILFHQEVKVAYLLVLTPTKN